MTRDRNPESAEALLAPKTRQDAASARDKAAARRDEVALDRDVAAAERDRRAGLRDDESLSVGLDHDMQEASPDREHAGRDQEDGGRDREDASRDREDASRDREDGGRDREDAGRDRREAAWDRDQAAEELQALTFDELTGTRRRGPGLHDLEQEIDRARRTGQQLAVAYVDVDGLKALNDTEGHAAGDQLLKSIADAMRASMRRYDLIVRLGGDEFLCILPGAGISGARSALDHVRDSIAGLVGHGSISVGVAELAARDTWEGLIARADKDLLANRGSGTSASGRRHVQLIQATVNLHEEQRRSNG